MSYYDLSKEEQDSIDAAGVDWDLQYCLEYNPQDYLVTDIKNVIAYVPGEHDGKQYYWIFQLKNNQIVYLTGGCDYTGWDCQSWANTTYLTDASILLTVVDDKEVLKSLIDQVNTKRKQTWREKIEEKLKVKNLPKI